MSVFDPFAAGSGTMLVLVSTRVGAMALVAPVFSARNLPVKVKTALVLLFTILLQPVALAAAPAGVALDAGTLLGEVLAGFAVGLGAASFVAAIELAGDLMTIQTGIAGAALLDPTTRVSKPVLAHFTGLFAVALFLSANGHLLVIRALGESLTVLPPGSATSLRGGTAGLLSLGGGMFLLGLKFAAPVVASVLVANTALALLARAAPTLNVLAVAFPVQIAAGLFTLACALPYLATVFGSWEGMYSSMLRELFGALGGR